MSYQTESPFLLDIAGAPDVRRDSQGQPSSVYVALWVLYLLIQQRDPAVVTAPQKGGE